MSDATQNVQVVSKEKVDVGQAIGKGIGVASKFTTDCAKTTWHCTTTFFNSFKEGVKEGWAER